MAEIAQLRRLTHGLQLPLEWLGRGRARHGSDCHGPRADVDTEPASKPPGRAAKCGSLAVLSRPCRARAECSHEAELACGPPRCLAAAGLRQRLTRHARGCATLARRELFRGRLAGGALAPLRSTPELSRHASKRR